MNRYCELMPPDEDALKRVRQNLLADGFMAYCQFCSASARTFSNHDKPTVDFRCATQWMQDRGWKRSSMCRRHAEENNA